MSNETIELGLRERKKRAARKAIQQSALELVAERGFCQVSVDDIAVAAGVSPRTFFNYYATKEDALFEPDIERLETASRHIAEADASLGVMSVVRETLLGMMDEAHYDLSAVGLRQRIVEAEPTLVGGFLRTSQSTQSAWVESLKERFATEEALPTGYIELVVAVAWTACGIALRIWSAGGQNRSIGHILARQLDQLEAGLDTPLPTA